MGNAGSVREERGESSADLMESPPHSPRGSQNSPLLFTPQVLMAPLRRDGEPRGPWMQTPNSTDYNVCEQGIPTMITWSHGGKEVAVEGSWDNWKTKQLLQKSGKEFSIMKVLPSGFYEYRFIVDGNWRYAPDLPSTRDEMGNAYNILELQDSVPEDIESIASFEPPRSPESSYSNRPLLEEDTSKAPPLVPPQLEQAFLNGQNIRGPFLTRPQHVALNHLYIQKDKDEQRLVSLGSTCRFMSKYVTVVLYKSLQR